MITLWKHYLLHGQWWLSVDIKEGPSNPVFLEAVS